MEDKPFIDKGDTSAKSKINPKVTVYNFIMDHYNIYDSYKTDPNFKIVDTIFGMYSPIPSLKDFHGFQIYRTYAEKSDSSYIVGVFSINLGPYKGDLQINEMDSQPPKFLMNGNDRFYNEKSCYYLTTAQLKRINAKSNLGIIYNIKITKPFKGKFNQCKIVACENANGDFFTLYYFYNMQDELRISKKILSQIGIVGFK